MAPIGDVKIKTTIPAKEYFTFKDLICIGPFRLFFPLAVVCGLLGVGHWALWSVGWIKNAEGLLHALIQTQGFLGCIAAGFLMTFLPRIMGVRDPSPIEIGFGFAMALFIPLGFIFKSLLMMEFGFLFLLLDLMQFGLRRLPHKTKDHPPVLFLLDFGVVHALAGTVLIIINEFWQIPFQFLLMGRQMVQLGFLLCLVLGMTGFLGPYLTGHLADKPSIFTKKPAQALTGFLLLASFILEPWVPQSAGILRAVIVCTHMLTVAKIARPNKKATTTARLFKISTMMVPLGVAAAAVFPMHRAAALHITFIGGFSLMIFSFGSIVVLTHSAQAALLNKPSKLLWAAGASVILSLILRVWSDVYQVWYFQLIHHASGLWILGAILWLIYIWPKLWINPLPSQKIPAAEPES